MRKVLTLLIVMSGFGHAQAPPATVQLTHVDNITSSSGTIIDNRSAAYRQNNAHLFCAIGPGTWSVTIQYQDGSTTGSWTNFSDPTATVAGSPLCVGAANGYHDYIRFSFSGANASTVSVSYSGLRNVYQLTYATSASGPAGGDLSGSYPNPTVAKINGTSLASLASGLMFNTNGTGVPSIVTSPSVIISLFSGCSGTQYLGADGSCHTPGTITSITTNSPVTGGPVTSGAITLGCPGCVTSYLPGVGVAHFAGGNQVVTSSAVSLTADVSGTLPVGNGGTGTASTLTGLVRGGPSAMTASELSGDATTSGSNVVTVSRINGTSLAGLASGVLYNTTGTGILSIAPVQGNGSKVQLSTGTTTTGHCVQYDASGNTVDAGALCGTITALTGDVVASGPGSSAATVKAVNGTTLSSLATGLYWNTTATGVPSIATGSQVLGVIGAGNIGNSYLTNSGITFGSTAQALGSTVTNLNGVNVGPSTPATGSFTSLSASTLTVNGAASSQLVSYFKSPTGNASYLEVGSASSNYAELEGDSSGNFLLGHYGVTSGVLQSIRSGAVSGTIVMQNGNVRMQSLGTGPVVSNSGVLGNATVANYNGILPVTLCTACALNGTTDDTAAFQTWLNSVANGSTPVTISLAGKTVYLSSPTLQSPFTIPSNVQFIGPGTIKGTAVNETGGYPLPTSYISIAGTLGTAYSYGSTIAQGTSAFTLSNGFSEAQMFLLSNFPYDSSHATGTYPQGSDTCTLVTGNPQNQCSYPVAIATTKGTASGSSTTLTVSSGAGTANGQYIAGTNIPANTTIVSGGGTTTWTISNATTGAISGATINTYATAALAVLNNDVGQEGPNNQRQNRREEVGLIRSATGSSILLMEPVVQAYTSTTALQFQVVNPAQNIEFYGVTLSGLWIQMDLSKNVSFRGGNWFQTSIGYSRSLYGTMDPDYDDAQNCDCGVAVGLGSRHMDIRGNYGNGAINSDNGLVRCDMCSDTTINVNLGGTSQSPSGVSGGEVMENIIVDTGYFENPTGYTSGGDYNLNIKATAAQNPCQVGLVMFGSSLAPIENVNIEWNTEAVQGTTSTCYGAAVQMSGVSSGRLNMEDPYGTLYVQGTHDVKLSGHAHRFYSAAPVTLPYGWGSSWNNDALDFNGITFVSASTDGTAGVTPMYCQYCDHTKLSNVTFDQRNYNNGVNIGNTSTDIWYGNVNWLMTGAATPAFDCSAFTGTLHILGDVQYQNAINVSDCGTTSTYLHGFTSNYGATIGDPTSSSQIVNISRHVRYVNSSFNPGTVPAGGVYSLSGQSLYSVALGEAVSCGFSALTGSYSAMTIGANVTAFGTIQVNLYNPTGSSLAPGAGQVTCDAFVH